MSNYRPPKPGSNEQRTIFRPASEILAEDEAERLQMHLDLEAGRITPEELRKRNGIDCSGVKIPPFKEQPIYETENDFDLEAWLEDPIPMILRITE